MLLAAEAAGAAMPHRAAATTVAASKPRTCSVRLRDKSEPPPIDPARQTGRADPTALSGRRQTGHVCVSRQQDAALEDRVRRRRHERLSRDETRGDRNRARTRVEIVVALCRQ